MQRQRPIFFDTETTGIRADKDRIIEIAAFDPEQDKTFVSLIKPDIPIPEEATQIHGITEEMVKDAPSFKEIGIQFRDFCEGNVVLIAHNGDSFDKPFLEWEFKRHQLKAPNWPFLDSLKWARKYRPDLPRHSLQHLREVYSIASNNAHRALDDVIILHQVFSYMVEDLPIHRVIELLSAPPPPLRCMPFGKYKGRPFSDLPKHYIQWLHENGVLDKEENTQLKEALKILN